MTTMLDTRSPQMPSIGTLHGPKRCGVIPDPNDQGFRDDRDYDCGDDNPSNRLPPTMEFSMSPPRSTSMNSLKPLPRSPLLSQLRAAADEPPPVPSKMGLPHHPAGKELPLQSAQEPQKQSGLQPPPPSPAESLSSI
ncbi:hypothetical protein CDV31_017110, partial [Fusarium ambrosium]